MAARFSFSIRDRGAGRVFVIQIAGELDAVYVEAIHRLVDRIPPGETGAIDLRQVTFIDSTALSAIIAVKRARGDNLKIVGATPPILHVFEEAGAAEALDNGVL
ncbi:MAG: STAS domain-containing protein [Thermoleophilaceae bacterium]